MIPNPQPNINDNITCDNLTWSSNKIAGAIASSSAVIDDETISTSKTWSSKHISDQISEEYLNMYVVLDDTLEAAATSLEFTSDLIAADSLIDIYTNDFSVYPTAASQTDGSLTLTFTAQAADVDVSIRIWIK